MMDRNKGGKFSLKQNKKDQQISYSVWGKESKGKKKETVIQQKEENREGQPSLPVLKDKRALYENTR